ncbi:GH39 family glycosyl hydrolase [Williamsia sp. MIQD14]|uniref:GH39 family glycosyl hydrolase n=1 Tax=Williamsia sp. MIQD14 TaxID=3425703 RepID=UPI003DA09B26
MAVALVVLAVLTTACGTDPAGDTATSTASTRPTPVAAAPQLVPIGVNGGSMLIVEDDTVLERSLSAMNDLGVRTLRLDLAWPFIEPVEGVFNWAPVDRVVDAARAHGIEIVGVVDYTPRWQAGGSSQFTRRPASATEFGRFAGDVAEHYSGRVSTLEIWNEPNGGYFFRPRPDPVFYTSMLKAAYRQIKAADPRITVLGGSVATAVDTSTTMNGRTFVEKMYAAGAAGYMDALSVHPYSYPTSYSTDPLDPDGAMRMVAGMYSVMQAYGDGDKKIWATEVGFPTSGTPISDAATQAAIITESIREWSQLSFAGPILVQELRDRKDDSADREDTFGIMRVDFSAKPLYTSLKSLIASDLNDDVVYQRVLGASARAQFPIGGAVTPWYRQASPRGTQQIRQEFTGGAVTCWMDRCFASPTAVVAAMDKAGSTPTGPMIDGRQPVDDLVSTEYFWSPQTGAHPLSGEMLDAWRPQFGLPMTDEFRDGNTTVVRCQFATLRRPGRGSVTVDPV